MDTDFTQDTVLHFLQSRGGSVKNAELLQHFKPFLREHPDRDRNRELFKKFINSVATVQQVDDVSCVVLRKKYRGHVPGTGERSRATPAAERTRRSPAAGGSDKPPPPPPHGVRQGEVSGAVARKTVLPAAGIVLHNHNNNNLVNLKQQHVPSGPGVTRLEAPAQRSEVKTPKLPAPATVPRPGPPPGIAPVARQNGGPGYLEQHPVEVKPTPQQQQQQQHGGLHHRESPPQPETTRRPPQPENTRPPPQPETTRRPPQPEATRPPPQPETTRQPPQPENTRRPPQPENTRPPPQPETTRQPPQPENTRPPPQPENTRPPPQPKTTRPPPQPENTRRPPQPEATRPPPQPETTRPPPQPEATRRPPQPETTRPPPQPETTRQPPQPETTRPPPQPETTRRHFRHRQSYKTAVSYDEDDNDYEEEESSQIRRVSAGGGAAWPLNAPLGSTGRAISASTPCITDPPASPLAAVSPLTRKKVPQIYIQGATEEVPRGPASVPAGPASPSLPLEAERYRPPAHTAPQQNFSPHGGSPEVSSRARLSSSHSSLLTPSPGPTSRGSLSPTSRGSPWNSSYEDLQARTGGVEGGVKIQEAPQRTQRPRMESAPHHADSRAAAHWYHSSDNLYQEPAGRGGRPWHHSTGNLPDDPEDGGSSDGPAYSPAQQQRGGRHPSRVSSQLRNRMCRSMGADLDQLLQEEESRRGHEAARLGRLALLSSSLSLGRHLSSSSLSSCQSLGELADEGPQGRRSFPPDSFTSTSTSSPAHRDHTSKQSLVPLEPREHDWLVKGAAAAWPDIYSLFREDPSLLNRQDFISGYTVLHWIAKHGDHRVLNTLWYGVEKAGLNLDVNARSTSGHTPLHVAAMHGHKSMMRLLVGKFQADVSRRDNAGKKPWQYLRSSGTSQEVWQLLGASPPSPSRRDGGGGVRETKEHQQQQQPQRRRRRHHFSTASSGPRPTVIPSSRVKRSTSLAAFLKHKTLQRFQGHQSDSSL
ncbi:uncharacterized protein sowahb isoform X2 [Nelusetta ayraudi]|uniref:uncharacterized protein sowahb isoform X2 n=1 Tax=Nelusetta ayraudi TaxID=303726 RepID=UPI003F723498